jgi:hypothetical protein
VEQSLEPGLPPPEEVTDPYLAEVFRNCAANSGRIFLAEADGAVAGFICVLAKVIPSADDGSHQRPAESRAQATITGGGG